MSKFLVQFADDEGLGSENEVEASDHQGAAIAFVEKNCDSETHEALLETPEYILVSRGSGEPVRFQVTSEVSYQFYANEA